MILGIAAELSAPPSSPSCFRDCCLYAKIFRGYDVLALSPLEMQDAYARWFRLYGLFDYIDDILPPGQVVLTVEIEGGGRLTAHNIHAVLGAL